MRVTRVEKFRRSRYRKAKLFLLFVLLIPCICVFVGYVITSVIILPGMK